MIASVARVFSRAILGWCVLTAVASASAQSLAPNTADVVLIDSRGERTVVQQIVRSHRLTTIVFYSSTCPCFGAHSARLRDLARELSSKGVEFVLVDSERHASGEVRPPPPAEGDLPVFRDEGGRLARQLDARYATESFVFDSSGQLRYRGGIDDERKHLTPKPKTYLRDALIQLLAGGGPAYTTSKALGCALRLM